jgi:Caspase domain
MRHIRFLLALIAFVSPILVANAQVQDESRLALLIGNANYKSSPLQNPVNDVRLMEKALTEAGFTIIKAENASRREMQRMVRDFGERLKQSGGVGLFYFAGHGVQVKGANYLVPVDADIRAEDEVAFDSIDAQSVLEKMETAKNRINLLILDACRDNPFAKGSRSGSTGLATMSAPSGSLVAYSTSPGSVASDGAGNNGLYTQHLAAVMRMPDMPIEEVFKRVRANVRKDSANQQTPWENTALEGNFYFKKSPPPVVAAIAPAPQSTIQAPPAAPNMMAVELAYWDSIKGSNRPFELEAYIEQFPNGAFVGLAKARLRELIRELAAAKEREERVLAKAQEEKLAMAKELELARVREAARDRDSSRERELIKEREAAREKAASLELALAAARAQPGQMVAMATPAAIRPSPAAITALNIANLASGQNIGTLQIIDRMFNNKVDMRVVVSDKSDTFTLLSTGDKIGADGQVIAVRFGDFVFSQVTGSLWKFPLKVGDKGQADVSAGNLNGRLQWQVKLGVTSNDLIVQAEYAVTGGGGSTAMSARSGTWSGEYDGNQSIPNTTSFFMRASASSAGSRQQITTTKLTMNN